MSEVANRVVQKLWSYCNMLRDDGLSYQEYLEQLTLLLFLKMADERATLRGEVQPIPEGYRWADLANPLMEGEKLERHYRDTLRELGRAGGMLGLIFEKAQNRIQDPAKLRQLVVELIGKEQWSSMSADVKGDAYEGLLEKNASDVKGGAGQYFTPRSVIQAMVACIQPRPGEVIVDPAAGTGGFLLATHDHLVKHFALDPDQKKHLRYEALRGVELVPGVSRLCAMNLYLHGIGPDGTECKIHKKADHCPEGKDADGRPLARPCTPWPTPITTDDALRTEATVHADVVLTNPPFGKKSSITVVDDEGDTAKQTLTYNRAGFTATSNKQLNFVQHVKTLLKIHGRAAVVVPDNVLFEGGAGETIRRKLLHDCDVHTLLRLPTGIFYAQGVKANVLFFDRKPGAKDPWTKTLWVYDLRTNLHFTLKQNTMTRADLDGFVECYRPGDRHQRTATWSAQNPEGRWRAYPYSDLISRDKVGLDLFWLRDESLEDSASLPDPHILAQEIADDLQSALEQIQDILGDLEARAAKATGRDLGKEGQSATKAAEVTTETPPPQPKATDRPASRPGEAPSAPLASGGVSQLAQSASKAHESSPPTKTADPRTPRPSDLLSAALAALEGSAHPLSRSELIETSGIAEDAWDEVRKAFEIRPDIYRFGERRGTRYLAVSQLESFTVNLISRHGAEGANKADIVSGLAEAGRGDLNEEWWRYLIDTLCADGRLVKSGQGRGTRYRTALGGLGL